MMERPGAAVPASSGRRALTGPAPHHWVCSVSNLCPFVFQDKHHDAAHEIIETIR